jgi:energy-converting hydrogenase Eha subunit B
LCWLAADPRNRRHREGADMAINLSDAGALLGVARGNGVLRSAPRFLSNLTVAAGFGWSVLFVVIALRYELQMYGDGSIFSYAVAVQDAWAFHWHNVSVRLFTYVFSFVPAETYVALTGHAKGGIVVYGLMQFAAPLLGLLATLAADRSKDRVIFQYTCLSTACLCPLVFGFPTEMWMAHALFWPALAVCHYAPVARSGAVAVFAALLALLVTHEGAVLFGLAILATLVLRGCRDPAFIRAVAAFTVAMTIWLIVKLTLRPDDYISGVILAAAFRFIDIGNLGSPAFLLLLATLAGYLVAVLLLRPASPVNSPIYAGALVAVALAVYWIWFDRSLHSDDRYVVRTALLIATPLLGALAALRAVERDDRRMIRVPFLPQLAATVTIGLATRYAAVGMLLVMLVHAVETAKFAMAWEDDKAAVLTLARGTASDPALGDPHFVSAQRIDAKLNRLSWNSTTPFLSVLVTPRFATTRLVVDPNANYFWLPCATARKNEEADRAVLKESRRLIRLHACLHR